MENKTVNNTSQAEARKTILVVEDNEIVSYLLSVILEDNYNIEIRADGKEALNYLAQGNRPNLILLDVLMPNMNGYSFLRRISNKPALGKIPVIFITTIDCKKTHERRQRYGGRLRCKTFRKGGSGKQGERGFNTVNASGEDLNHERVIYSGQRRYRIFSFIHFYSQALMKTLRFVVKKVTSKI